jgi:hypothetical protein
MEKRKAEAGVWLMMKGGERRVRNFPRCVHPCMHGLRAYSANLSRARKISDMHETDLANIAIILES